MVEWFICLTGLLTAAIALALLLRERRLRRETKAHLTRDLEESWGANDRLRLRLDHALAVWKEAKEDITNLLNAKAVKVDVFLTPKWPVVRSEMERDGVLFTAKEYAAVRYQTIAVQDHVPYHQERTLEEILRDVFADRLARATIEGAQPWRK